MDIHQFEKKISKIFVTRGKNYYKDGHIIELKPIATNAWRAYVSGSDAYFVYVELTNTQITTSVCTCPFDGPFCKHEVAVYYAIREQLQQTPTVDFSSDLQQKSKEELLVILEKVFTENPTLPQQYLQENQAPTEMTLIEAEERIYRVLNYYLKNEYIDISDADDAFEGLDDVLQDVEQIASHNKLHAMEHVLHCLEIVGDILIYCDDDVTDELFDKCSSALNPVLIPVIAEKARHEAKQLTQLLLKTIPQAVIHTSYVDLIMRALIELSPLSDSRNELEHVLHTYCEKFLGDEEYALHLFQLIEKVGSEEEQYRYYKKSLSNTLRIRVIEMAITKKHFEEALTLCAEGIDLPTATPYYAKQWLEHAFFLHGMLGNTSAQRSIAFELAVKGYMEEFERFKQLYAEEPDIWPEVLENFILTVEEEPRIPYHFLEILKEEEQWGRLLYACQQNAANVLRFGGALQPYYAREIEQLMTSILLEKAEVANSRSAYHELAMILTRFKDLGYGESAQQLKQHLLTTYPRKRALSDELSII